MTNSNLESNKTLKGFQEVYIKDETDPRPEISNSYAGKDICDCHFYVEEVKGILDNLKVNWAPITNGIHPKALKECGSVLAYLLLRIFKWFLEISILPQSLKTDITLVSLRKNPNHIC